MYRGRASSYSQGQGQGRGRGRGRGNALRSSNWRGRSTIEHEGNAQKGDAADSPLGRLITNITLRNISNHGIQTEDARITDCKYVASYSLVDSSSPRIIIPGQPALWEPPQLPCQLQKDSGEYFRDQNGARFPEHPMQPSVQSIFALNKSFDSENVDIMGCASSLGNILRFVRSVDSTFRFDVEMVGNTLFLVNNQRDEVIQGVHGNGMTFLEKFTTYQAELKETKSHQRIISYSFGGLKCLVRFECDGHLSNTGDASTERDSLRTLNISKTPVSSSITVKEAGLAVSQHSIIEIKTRSQLKGQEIEMNEHWPRLWVRQIPNFIVGYHIKGNFEDVQNKNVQPDIDEWESAHESELRKFASILQQLIVEVKRAGNFKLELCRTGLGPLELREQIGTPREVLPNDWKNLWIRGGKDIGRDGESRLSDDDDQSYPSFSSRNDGSSESEGSEEEDNFSVDYTACGLDCGYCGHCEY
ncbi:uncharacterized protein F4807DRAFT_430871 [Annulohypoxylon truncatum]|uniref:uncharacterized protein n=1 Tax=Annulohypoxylon truncatum TaxID=327061 RepID=UPI002007A3B4|nr:uncharacterized protein F4807DRAFT_430871 [Annulohypoxylon truncatum]KAI1208326.1 hypothetical protein F4807DRAFT_430871 [Annulohypoxylon truncatum]